MPTSEGLHEPWVSLSADVIDRHRAIASLGEELEAVDWYDQRVNGTTDASLAAVLSHNRDEEKEHFAMVLEWYRRRDAKMDAHLKEYLFTTGSLIAREQASTGGGEGGGEGAGDGGGSLGIGSLKGGQSL